MKRRCGVCFRHQPVKRNGELFKHSRGQETCAGSGAKVTRQC